MFVYVDFMYLGCTGRVVSSNQWPHQSKILELERIKQVVSCSEALFLMHCQVYSGWYIKASDPEPGNTKILDFPKSRYSLSSNLDSRCH